MSVNVATIYFVGRARRVTSSVLSIFLISKFTYGVAKRYLWRGLNIKPHIRCRFSWRSTFVAEISSKHVKMYALPVPFSKSYLVSLLGLENRRRELLLS